jgi:MerR family transcriptional regulator, redox-sensitive transcriptional activator SoxR
MSEYSIGQVANAAGIAASAIRYYEKIGLIPGPGRKSGHRRYSREVFSRLTLIQLCKQLGFDLAEVKTLLDGVARGDRSTKPFRQLAAKKLPKVEESIAQAQLMRDLLVQATTCACPSLDECAARAQEIGMLACPPVAL